VDLAFPLARERFAAGDLSGAELACVYVAERVRRDAPRHWVQGPRRPALDAGDRPSDLVQLFATRDVYRLPRPVAEALVAWATGRRQVEVFFSLPSPAAVLGLQARGRRCVSLLDDAAVPAGPVAGLPRREGAYGSGGLAFAVHDLCHLEKFAARSHHREQVGFFAALERALAHPAWAALERGFDATWENDRDHVLADMNRASAFLFVVLRNKVKLAVRRRVGRARGEPCRSGALDEGETRAYEEAVETLLEALGLTGDARDAARRMASRHEAEAAGEPLRAFFVEQGEAAARGPANCAPVDPRGPEAPERSASRE
jgi:hypothetical protein